MPGASGLLTGSAFFVTKSILIASIQLNNKKEANQLKKIQCLSLILAALLVLTLAGCSEGSTMVSTDKSEAYYEPDYDNAVAVPGETIAYGSGVTADSAPVQNQKLVRTVRMEVQTQDMDGLLSQLDAKVRQLQGYVENKSVYNGSATTTKRVRSANLTVRIPVASMDDFVAHVSGAGNVTSLHENADDITLKYVDTESRVKALQVEQERLLELLEKAESMSDLLQIEARLTDVRAELEAVTSQLRRYDNMVSYATLQLTVSEVKEYTEVKEELTTWQRIGNGLSTNLQNLGSGAVELFILFVVSLPYLAVLGALAAAVVFIIKLCNRKGKQKQVGNGQAPDTPAQ